MGRFDVEVGAMHAINVHAAAKSWRNVASFTCAVSRVRSVTNPT